MDERNIHSAEPQVIETLTPIGDGLIKRSQAVRIPLREVWEEIDEPVATEETTES